jgi:hypothetical protein
MEMKLYFNEYFKIFRDNAPKDMVEWGGYQNGEPTGMASSYESCMALYDYIKEEKETTTILDAGAGASSWMFRKLFKNVVSTDPDKDYLEVVKNIVGGENYIVDIQNCPICDYVYWDYGNIQRIPMMSVGLSKCKIGMYIDDCHDNEVLEYAIKLAKENNCNILKTDSLDDFGRWGIILEKK